MDSETKEIIYKQQAKQSIVSISQYIAEKGYPETSKIFAEKLYAFGNSLLIFPNKYSVCRHPQLRKRNMRCALFHKNYIFVYKKIGSELVIHNVIHSKTLK